MALADWRASDEHLDPAEDLPLAGIFLWGAGWKRMDIGRRIEGWSCFALSKFAYKLLTKTTGNKKGVRPHRPNSLNFLVAGRGFEPLTFGL
jgi:hypothetical protein